MDLSPDPLQAQLRRALRAGLAGVADRPAVRGTPVSDGPDSPARELLSELGMLLYELPVTAGVLADECSAVLTGFFAARRTR